MKTGFGEFGSGRIGSFSDPENEVASNVILGTPEFRSRVLRGLHFSKLQRAVIDRPRIAPGKTTETCRRLLSSFGFGRFLNCGQIGKVIEQHSVNENVTAAYFLQENQLRALVEEFDELEWRISLQPESQS
jgi:hypothetical protein